MIEIYNIYNSLFEVVRKGKLIEIRDAVLALAIIRVDLGPESHCHACKMGSQGRPCWNFVEKFFRPSLRL